MRNKKVTTIYMEPDQAEALDALSKQTRVPKAVLIRDGIERVLRQARTVGAIPPVQKMSPTDAEEVVRIMQERGVPPCTCGMMALPHYHMNENKA